MALLSEITTHTATSTMTMTDSDGILKWSPHNLLTYSEQFDNAAWAKDTGVVVSANSVTAPDGTETADTVTLTGTVNDFIQQQVSGLDTSVSYTFSVWLRVSSGTASISMGNIDAGVYEGKTVTTEWQLFSITQTPSSATRFPRPVYDTTASADTVYIWGAHLYRSDLGGMVDNPTQPAGFETYVPTAADTTGQPELLTNGDFDNGSTAPWNVANGTLTVVSGELELDASSGAHLVRQEIDVAPGETYLFQWDARLGTMASVSYSVYDNTNAADIIAPTSYAASTTTQTFPFLFTAPAGCLRVSVYPARDSGAAGTVYFDNLTVKRSVDPSVARYLPREGHHLYNSATAKWNAHNLITYSEQFDDASWVPSNATVVADQATAPDGTLTADEVEFTSNVGNFANLSFFPTLAQVEHTQKIWIKAFPGEEGNTLRFDTSAGGGGNVEVTLTDEWQLVGKTLTGDPGAVGIRLISYPGDTASKFYVWGAHLYRSDLNGVTANSGNAVSGLYVPTEGTAVPATLDNNVSYDNEGLFLESEARTNAYTTSEDLTAADFVQGGSVAAPDADRFQVFTEDTATSEHRIFEESFSTTSGQPYTLSCEFEYIDRDWVFLAIYDNATTRRAWFNLSTGAVGSVDSGATATIKEVGVGVYACSITKTSAGATGSSGNAQISSSAGDNLSATFLGTGASWGARNVQFEEGATPSSYIPTVGTAETRALETMIIPAGTMPTYTTPTVIGPELVTNGTFDTDVTGWTPNGVDGGTDTSFAWNASGYMDVTRGAGTTAGMPFQNFTTVAGKVYQISVDIVSAQRAFWVVGNSFGGGTLISTVAHTGNTTVTKLFVAQSTSSYVQFWTDNSATTSVDNVSVKEINPLAVCLNIEGTVTYANTGTFDEVRPYYWAADASNFIEHIIRADGNIGQPYWRQRVTTADKVEGPVNTYPPGVNVPFSTAARHGSTFINGAADGTTTTANTTPTSIVDLSATDFEIGRRFMGTIKSLRIWNEDIADAGITEATS